MIISSKRNALFCYWNIWIRVCVLWLYLTYKKECIALYRCANLRPYVWLLAQILKAWNFTTCRVWFTKSFLSCLSITYMSGNSFCCAGKWCIGLTTNIWINGCKNNTSCNIKYCCVKQRESLPSIQSELVEKKQCIYGVLMKYELRLKNSLMLN